MKKQVPKDKIKKKPRKKLNYFSRGYLIYIPLIVALGAIIVRLVLFQVIQANELSALGITNRMVTQTLVPDRGTISASNGNVLVRSVPAQQIIANPRLLTQSINKHQYTKMSKEDIAKTIGSLIGQDPQAILDKLNKDLEWISIAHQIDIDKTNKIRAMKIPGLDFIDEAKRVYLLNSWASSVLGFVNQAGHGIGGVEAFYDKYLCGVPGKSVTAETPNGQLIPDAPSTIQPQLEGDNLTLTLNMAIQNLVEQQLTALESSTHAKSVTIVALEPKTGKVLGMGTTPSFNPNNAGATSPDNWINRAIGMNYEPGSTFKIVTGSSALDEGVITPFELFSDPGFIKIQNHMIMNWDYGMRPAGDITFTKGMEQSSNVVLSQVGLRLGLVNFYKYLRSFGFGTKTGIDIAGEESGLIIPQASVKQMELATMSFGQANMVTPIQLSMALCAVANGGALLKPYVVDKITSPDGTLVLQNKPTKIREVIAKKTSDEMIKVMESVVENGTGQLAKIPGIKVAGKSGTAQEIDPVTKTYSSSSFVASFEAFAPADDPKIAVLVIVDSPKGVEHEGGPVCSPYAKVILQGALQEFNIPFGANTPSSVTITPSDPLVRPVIPPTVPERQPLEGESVVPNLTGMSMRQAGEALTKAELHFNFKGSGLASQQTPVAGKVVTKGASVDVTFATQP